jgi:hypothetical protein
MVENKKGDLDNLSRLNPILENELSRYSQNAKKSIASYLLTK